jgi:hypothetical protein
MQDHASERLSKYGSRVTFVLSDLAIASWSKKVARPFDLVVSGIALHNLRDRARIFRCYSDILKLLAPKGCFLDYDYFKYAGGVDTHVAAMKDAGFSSVECLWQEGAAAIIRAR